MTWGMLPITTAKFRTVTKNKKLARDHDVGM